MTEAEPAMSYEWIFDLIAYFPVPHLPIVEPDIILVRGRVRIIPLVGLLQFGLLGVSAAGVWVVGALYSARSRETVLAPESTGKVRAAVEPDVAGGISVVAAKSLTPKHDGGSSIAEEPSAGDAPAATGIAPVEKTINISAFAPPFVSPGDDFYIQIMLHSPEHLCDAQTIAEALEKTTRLFKSMPLYLPLTQGDQVRVTVDGRGAEVQEPDQTFVWRGYLAHIAFAARLPAKLGERAYKPLVRIFVNGAPAGIIALELKASFDAGDATVAPVAKKALRFNKIFLSYASQDRAKVLDMAKMLRAQKINFFQDLLSLEPGERWERRIYEEIANCDAFYLFWSSSAKKSEWVIKEAVLALQCQQNSPEEIPYFSPIIIEGPPIVEPPPELSGIHFNDPLQNVVLAEELIRKKLSADPS